MTAYFLSAPPAGPARDCLRDPRPAPACIVSSLISSLTAFNFIRQKKDLRAPGDDLEKNDVRSIVTSPKTLTEAGTKTVNLQLVGRLGLSRAFDLDTACDSRKNVCWKPACCWLR